MQSKMSYIRNPRNPSFAPLSLAGDMRIHHVQSSDKFNQIVVKLLNITTPKFASPRLTGSLPKTGTTL